MRDEQRRASEERREPEASGDRATKEDRATQGGHRGDGVPPEQERRHLFSPENPP